MGLDGGMLTYKQVETALAKLHFVHQNAMGAFRGRIKNFQKLGIVTSSPGRGKKKLYEVYDLMLWAFCFELSELGIDPKIMKAVLPNTMPFFLDAIEKVDRSRVDVFLVWHPNIMAAYMQKSEGGEHFNAAAASYGVRVLEGDRTFLSKIDEGLTPKVDFGMRPTSFEVFSRRVALLNVSRLKRQLEVALSEIPEVPAAILKNIKFERVASRAPAEAE
jgi:hypothetical protein